jgi:hypothetical protein
MLAAQAMVESPVIITRDPAFTSQHRRGLPHRRDRRRRSGVGAIGTVSDRSTLKLKIDPRTFGFLPSNIEAEIKSSTAFGAKYVDLVVPGSGASPALQPGSVLKSRNVQSVVASIDPAKLNSVLSAFAEAGRRRTHLCSAAEARFLTSPTNPLRSQYATVMK